MNYKLENASLNHSVTTEVVRISKLIFLQLVSQFFVPDIVYSWASLLKFFGRLRFLLRRRTLTISATQCQLSPLLQSMIKNVKVKVTLVQALKLCTGRTAHRGSRGIALRFHDHSTGMGWGVSVTPRSLFTPGKDPLPNVQEAGWAPGPVWTGAEHLAPTGIRSPDRPACNQSL